MKKLFLFAIALLVMQLAHAQWEEDFRLTETVDTSFLSYSSHKIASNGDTVHVVWWECIDENHEIFYERSTDGGYNWDGEIRLTETEGFSENPAVSVSGSSVYVVWEERIDGNKEIFFIRSVDGGTNWEEAVRLTDDPQTCYLPDIASNGSYIHVVWFKNDPDQQTWKIYYKHSTDGGLNWSTESWLSTNSPEAYYSSIAMSDSDVHVVWSDNRDLNLEIYYRKSSDNGTTWGPETRLTNAPASSNLPSIATSGSSVNITWQDKRSGFYDVYFKGSTDGGENWTEDIRVVETSLTSEYPMPEIACSDSVLHVVWMDRRSGKRDVYYKYSMDGGLTWIEETRLNDFSKSSMHPYLAVSGPLLHVIWCDWRDDNFEIYYKRNPTGGAPVSIDENIGSISTFVYPNPASWQLTVDGWQSAVGGRQSSVKLSIVDLFGRVVKNIGEINALPYHLDISGLPDGVYILKMAGDSGNTGAVKFVKQGNGY